MRFTLQGFEPPNLNLWYPVENLWKLKCCRHLQIEFLAQVCTLNPSKYWRWILKGKLLHVLHNYSLHVLHAITSKLFIVLRKYLHVLHASISKLVYVLRNCLHVLHAITSKLVHVLRNYLQVLHALLVRIHFQ